jgi:hypothetical protein
VQLSTLLCLQPFRSLGLNMPRGLGFAGSASAYNITESSVGYDRFQSKTCGSSIYGCPASGWGRIFAKAVSAESHGLDNSKESTWHALPRSLPLEKEDWGSIVDERK